MDDIRDPVAVDEGLDLFHCRFSFADSIQS